MTYIPKVKFYDLARFFGPENQTNIEESIESIKLELSKKFQVTPEKIEIDAKSRMSIIYCA